MKTAMGTLLALAATAVHGYVNVEDTSFTPASASYSRTLNICAVPEPAPYALLLAARRGRRSGPHAPPGGLSAGLVN
ncbi:hypothetical protein ACN9MZ_03870 [Pseudoduganella sp. S-14]|uniref:hypothetical protein n=1 Tax=Pseudoduganella sp. S-14 TaxID=3404065 RepID=UPI003CF21B5B